MPKTPVTEPTPDEKRRAQLRVAEHAKDADECLELLRMIGLIDSGFHWVIDPSQHGKSKKRRVTTGQQ